MARLEVDFTAGYDFDRYDAKNLPALPAQEEEKWYAKFYYRGCAAPSEADAALYAPGNRMNPGNAVYPGRNIDLLTAPGHIPGDAGYCVLENGVGYGAACTRLETVPFAMFEWYKKLKIRDDLAYKIWYPGSHVSELGGVSIEDVGLGAERLDTVSPCSVKNLGFAVDPAEADPDFEALIGGNASISLLDNSAGRPPRALCLFHYVRHLSGGGCEFRTHFYVGAYCEDGQLKKQDDYSEETAAELARRMLSHCIHERGNLPYFLPELYEGLKDSVSFE